MASEGKGVGNGMDQNRIEGGQNPIEDKRSSSSTSHPVSWLSLAWWFQDGRWARFAVFDGSLIALIGYLGSLLYGAILAEIPLLRAVFRAIYTLLLSFNILFTWKVLQADLFDPNFRLYLFVLSTPWAITAFAALSVQVQDHGAKIIGVVSIIYALAFAFVLGTPFFFYVRKTRYFPSCTFKDSSFFVATLLLLSSILSLVVQFLATNLWRLMSAVNFISGLLWLFWISLKDKETLPTADVICIKAFLGLGIGLSTFATPSVGISLQNSLQDPRWPIFGLLYYVTISSLITIIAADALVVLPDGNKEELQLTLITLQFFQVIDILFMLSLASIDETFPIT